MRNRLFVAILGVVVAVGATVGIVVVSADPEEPKAPTRAKGFNPDSIKGKWTGEWRNTTFGSSGAVRANVKVKGEKFTPLIDFDGNVFGCNDPAAGAVTLKEGKGANRWNKKGFNASVNDGPAFGDLKLTYKHSDKSVTGQGSEPPCSPDITYTLDGTLTKKQFSADVKIQGSGFSADSTIEVTKD